MNLSVKLNIKTTYSVDTLVFWLKKNKETHIKEYTEAKTEYLKKKADLLSGLQDAVHTKGPEGITQAFYKWSSLTEPVDATEMYDQYIQLISASDANNIELSAADASAIVNDSWDWAQSAKLTNSTYLSVRN